jgi:glycosyltransferase involved in cell wall biosynthesis
LITHGVTGLLFQPADDEDLLSVLRQLMQEPHLRRSLAEAGRRAVREGYDMRRNTEHFAEILREHLPVSS